MDGELSGSLNIWKCYFELSYNVPYLFMYILFIYKVKFFQIYQSVSLVKSM